MAIAQERLTLEDFLRLPEAEPALEYEDGVITQKVSPKFRHSVLRREWMERVHQGARGRQLAQAFPELRTTFGGRSYVPDVSVLRWERIPVNEHGEVISESFTGAPDIAIEIASPGQNITALIRRCLWYVEHGVEVALLIDEEDRSVLLFRSGQPMQALRDDDLIDVRSVLPDFTLTVADLFAALRVR